MKKILLQVITVLVVTPFIGAKNPTETIYNKNGSIYMGHTVQQIFDGAESKTVFSTDSSVRVIPKKEVNIISSQKKNIDELNSESWKNWALAHPQLLSLSQNGDKLITLFQISLSDLNRNFQGFMLEKSDDNYKFFIAEDFSNDIIPDENIKLITYGPDDFMTLNGVIDEIVTIDGNIYKGQICSWDKEFTGILNEEGTVEIIRNNQIAQKKILPLNPDLPLIEQVRYLDIVESLCPVNGVITLRNRRPSNDAAPYYVIFNEATGKDEIIDMEKVTSIKRRINDKFKPLKHILISDKSDIMINGQKIDSVFNKAVSNEKAKFNGFEISQEYKPVRVDKDDEKLLKMTMPDTSLNNMIYVIPISKRRLLPNDKEPGYYFSFENLVKDNIDPVETLNTKLGNKEMKYKLSPGNYLIYRNTDRSSYLIQVL